MRKGRNIIGKPVIAYDTGEQFETVSDLIFDQNDNALLGFVVDEGGWFSSARVLLLEDVEAIGPDAVITPSKSTIIKADENAIIAKILARDNVLKGTQIMTLDGRDLGTMIDLYFDEKTGRVEGYEVSGGLFADAYSGRSFVPAPQTLKIGEDFAFVPSEIADLMEEQVGGIKAAVQSASDKVQDTTQATSDKLHEVAQFSSERAREVGRHVNTAITNRVIKPTEQKDFVLGKVAERDVLAPDGGYIVLAGQTVDAEAIVAAEHLGILDDLYRAAGGSVTEKLGERMSSAVASLTVEQTQGYRSRQMVQTSEGYIIAAPGQIVTPQVIHRAKAYHQEQALLNAVGLSNREAVQARTGHTGDHLKSSASDAGTQLQEGARHLWDQVVETAKDFKERSSQEIEDKRIRGALGRPVTRVILDRHDEVILNTGELITNQAIECARQADVLDLLLNSVYTESPQISLDEMRAPEPGKAAL